MVERGPVWLEDDIAFYMAFPPSIGIFKVAVSGQMVAVPEYEAFDLGDYVMPDFQKRHFVPVPKQRSPGGRPW